MQHVTRVTLALFFTVSLSAAIGAKTDSKPSEYKRSDVSYYAKVDVLKAEPNALIIAAGKYTEKNGSYFVDTPGKPPHVIYIQVETDWVEPITPPSMPASLGVAPDAMQIREPQGDVTVALPSAPANFLPAVNNMAIPNGAVVKTGATGTAAVLMGGVNSVRLIPNSSAAVQQTVTAVMRTTEVDLTVGAVFSKVGKRIGEKQDFEVHTPFGIAAAKGTDFVTVAMPARTDVWIAQGTVQLSQPDGKLVGTVTSEGTGTLKIIRNPPIADAHAAMMASSETMSAALNFIPTVNVYIKALDDKMAQGLKLTPTEEDYLHRIKKVPCLIRLALVEPPAPPTPPPAPAPVPPPPSPAAAVPAPAKGGAAPIAVQVALAEDGTVQVNGTPTGLDALPAKLSDIAKANTAQPILIIADDKVPKDQVKKVFGMCKTAKLTHVKRVRTAPPAPGGPMVISGPTAESAPMILPAPAPSPLPPPPAPATPAPPAKPTPPPVLTPIDLDLRADAKVDFQGATLTLAELKPKLQALGKATPLQPITVNGQEKVTPAQLKKVTLMLHAAKLSKVTVTPAAPLPAPVPPPAPAPAAAVMTPPVAPGPPIDLDVRADGKVDFQGGTLTLDELKPKLEAIAKSTPDQPIVVKKKEKLEKGALKKVVQLCRDAKLTKITVDKTTPPTAPASPAPAPSAAVTPAPQDNTPATPGNGPMPPASPAPPSKPLPPAMLLPMNLDLRPDGKIDFQGETITLDDLKIKLEEMGLTSPTQPIVVVPQPKTPRSQVKKVVALCLSSKLTQVSIAKVFPDSTSAMAGGTSPTTPTSSSNSEDVNASSPSSPSFLLSSSASLASMPATNDISNPPLVTKARTSHASALGAPISSGPNYTVP